MESTLFDLKPKARRTDPQTSQEAAERFDPTAHRAMIFTGIVAHPGLTCAELAQHIGLGYFQISKRMKEIEKMGLIVPGETRICSVNGSRMRTWNPVTAGGSRGDGSPRLEV
jgi:hypothetical protein